LDDYSFAFFYAKNNQNISVVELSKGLEYFRVIPRINYCKCEFFQCHVLQLPKGLLYHDLPPGEVGVLEYVSLTHLLKNVKEPIISTFLF